MKFIMTSTIPFLMLSSHQFIKNIQCSFIQPTIPLITSYNNNDQNKRTTISLSSTSTPPKKSSESNFWYAIPQKEQLKEEDIIPSSLSLDSTTLPYGSYRQLIKETSSMKLPNKVCLLTLGMNLMNTNNEDYSRSVVQLMHNYIDRGYYTFQIRNNNIENEFLKVFYDNTPKSLVYDILHITNKLDLSTILSDKDESIPSVKNKLKHSISSKLRTMNIDCINNLQFFTSKKSANLEYLDLILDILNDYYHRGIIQSYSLDNFPYNDIGNVKDLNFDIPLQSNTICNNLLYRDEGEFYKYYSSLPSLKLMYKHPLAGNLLSNQYTCTKYNSRNMNIDSTMSLLLQKPSKSEEYHFNQYKKYLQTKMGKNDLLLKYTNTLYKYLIPLSNKYNVSISSIALRWLLQFHPSNLGSILVDVSTSDDIPEYMKMKYKELQNVFTFELEDEDVVMLNDIAGIDMNRMKGGSCFEEDEEEWRKLMNDRSLWL